MIELAIGLWTGSIAVISDAFHTFSAVGGVLVAIVAARMALRPADEERSFGWARAEIIGALVNGGFLLAMAVVVIAMAAMRMSAPIDLPTGPMRLASFRNHQMVLLMMYTDCHQTKETKALYLFTIATHDQCDTILHFF